MNGCIGGRYPPFGVADNICTIGELADAALNGNVPEPQGRSVGFLRVINGENLRHGCTLGIRFVCGYGHARHLRGGGQKPLVYAWLRRRLCFGFSLWLPARGMALRFG